MTAESADLIVVGAGPAGTSAALTVAASGLDVLLFDSAPAAGGQVWRAPAAGLGVPAAKQDGDYDAGLALRADLAASTVRFRPGAKVWSVTAGFRVDVIGSDGATSYTAPRLVAATGGHERVVPFPGWTLPGVIGLAGATVLMKSQGMLPGRRVVVAGCGPLLVAVAAKIVAAGGTVVAVVDLASRSDWLRALPALATRPRLLRRGAGWMASLWGAGVPIFSSSTVVRAEGADRVQRVVIGPVPAGGAGSDTAERVIDDIDALVVGHGLVPGSEIARLLGAAHSYDRRRGGFVPDRDTLGRASVPGLYVAGDGSGVRGALPAVVAGRLAGLAAARDAGALTAEGADAAAATLLREAGSLATFSDAVAGLMAPPVRLVAAIAADTVVCRCEDVTRGEIEAAFDAGARDVNQLKHFTRCGMGPCQGRMCGDVVGDLAALRLGSREAAGCWTARPPLHPVPLTDLVGAFTYDDSPVPKPAPL